MPPPPPRLPNRGNFCLAWEGARGRVPAPGSGEGGRTGFLRGPERPAWSLTPLLPLLLGTGTLAFDQREEGTPVGREGLRAAKKLGLIHHLALACQDPYRSYLPLLVLRPAPGRAWGTFWSSITLWTEG